jgi:hypothetical protein
MLVTYYSTGVRNSYELSQLYKQYCINFRRKEITLCKYINAMTYLITINNQVISNVVISMIRLFAGRHVQNQHRVFHPIDTVVVV